MSSQSSQQASQQVTPQRQRLTQELTQQRWRLVHQLTALLDGPMTVLAFVWLGLLILDFTLGLSGPLEVVNHGIWALFVVHFALEFSIAPDKGRYLRRNWLTALALVLPAFRVLRVARSFRLLRAARATRSVGLLRLATSLNRGMRATRRALRRHGVGYVAALTVLVTLAGAAGMYALENPGALREAGYHDAGERGAALSSYGEAVWWTAMIMTTMGTDYWPKTVEGRVLCGFLALYAFAVFGYITATIASFFIGRDREPRAGNRARESEPEGAAALRGELAALRTQLASVIDELEAHRSAPAAECRG